MRAGAAERDGVGAKLWRARELEGAGLGARSCTLARGGEKPGWRETGSRAAPGKGQLRPPMPRRSVGPPAGPHSRLWPPGLGG